MPVYAFNPLDSPEWEDLVQRHPCASVFHTTNWLKALNNVRSALFQSGERAFPAACKTHLCPPAQCPAGSVGQAGLSAHGLKNQRPMSRAGIGLPFWENGGENPSQMGRMDPGENASRNHFES